MGVRNIAVTITGDGSSLSRALLRGAAEVDTFSRKAETSNRRLALSWKNTSAAIGAAGLAAVVGLTAAGAAAAQFETRMRNVNSLLQLNEAQFQGLSAATLDLSTKLPQSANTLAEGLYDISSSGFAGAEALQVLERSAEAASAGLTTTENSAQAITAVLNAYGLSAASAGDVSDTLFQTVNLGVISFQELTGVIGDVVGTAAAAKVPISEVGAAVATMTLTGLSAAESGTSLNRVLQSLIDPSEALATVFGQLGYESGAAALASKGLDGVLEDIRDAAGGNITTLLQLFPEIRAARGALALMSDEGRTYARVSAGIDEENARQGATHRALKEQMKATSAQFRLYRNEATAAAIEIGAKVLPTFISFLDVTRDLGHEAVPLLQSGISAVTPLMRTLYLTGQNVAEILGELFHAAEPVAAALLKIGGSAIIGGLLAVAKTLEITTGFLADHEQVVQAVAAIYLATLLPSVTAVTVAFNRFILTPVILGLNAMIGAAAGAATSLGALSAAMLSLQAVATLGLAVALYAVFRGFSQLHKAQADAREDIARTTAGFDALDTRRAQQTLADLRAEQLKSIDVGRRYEGTFGQFRAGWNALAGDNSVAKAAQQGVEASKAYDELNGKLLNTNANLVQLANTTGFTVEAIRKLAAAQNIDLSSGIATQEASDARKQVLSYMKDLEKQSRTTGTALQRAAGLDLEAVQKLAEALADVQKKAQDAFSRDTDVLGTFDPAAAAEAAASAADRVKTAEQNLADTRARSSADAKTSVSDSISIRKAQEELVEAQQAAARSAQEQPRTIAQAYAKTLQVARDFADDIQRATAAGLDTTAVTRLIELGPKQAGPILEQLVSDHSGRLIKLVNDSEAALAQIGQRVVEQARLTALATNAATDDLSRNLSAGLRVSGETLAQGSKATVQSVAKALGVPDARVRQLAQAYGITLRDEVQKGFAGKPLVPNLPGYTAKQDLTVPHRYAGGGYVRGPGSTTSDSIPALLSDKEYVINARAVARLGVPFLDRLNRQVPRFATGGYVGGRTVVQGGLSSSDVHAIAAALARMAPRSTSHTNHWSVYDYDAAMRQAADAESLSRLGGG